MTPSESKRMDQQTFDLRAWEAIKNAEAKHRNNTMMSVVATVSLVFSGAWWLSEQAASSKVAPVQAAVDVIDAKVTAQAQNTNARLDRMEAKIDKLIDMSLNNR